MTTTLLALHVLLACALLVALLAWRVRSRAWGRALALSLLVLLGTVLLVSAVGEVQVRTRPEEVGILALTGLLAVSGGGPVTTAVFGLVDARSAAEGSMGRAAEVLRGGAWIGALERLAVHAALVAGWPEGLAITLALKGLGRYPELRHQERSGIAERFLIGTFVSVLWAAACAGAALLLRG